MERERLTITLRKDILKLVDQSIDGAKLRNRSHAIEYFLSQQLTPQTVKVVLVVQSGLRKSYQAGGMPIGVSGSLNGSSADLKSILAQLENQGFKEVLLVGTDHTALEAAAVDAEKQGISAKISRIDLESLGSGDLALDQLKPNLRDEPFIYWDSRFKGMIDLASLIEFHKTARSSATAALAHRTAGGSSAASLLGLAGQLYGTRVVTIGGGDVEREGGLPLVGVFAFEPSLLDDGRNVRSRLYSEVLPKLVQEKKLNGFIFIAQAAAAGQRATAKTNAR